ncbi:MAG: hypothetical protein QW429_03870 [Thermoprotei archaeon]
MYESLTNYVLDSLEDLQKDPEKFLPYLRPLLQLIVKELLKEAQGNASKPLNLFGIKIPPELAQLLISRFLGGGETNINPFG